MTKPQYKICLLQKNVRQSSDDLQKVSDKIEMRQKKIPKPLYINGFRTCLAGAEGLEPSARGFGGRNTSLKCLVFKGFLFQKNRFCTIFSQLLNLEFLENAFSVLFYNVDILAFGKRNIRMPE